VFPLLDVRRQIFECACETAVMHTYINIHTYTYPCIHSNTQTYMHTYTCTYILNRYMFELLDARERIVECACEMA